MGAICSRDNVNWLMNKGVDCIVGAPKVIVNTLKKLNTLEGLEKTSSLIVSAVALFVLKNGREGAEGLSLFSSDFEALKTVLDTRAWINVTAKFYDKSAGLLDNMKKMSREDVKNSFREKVGDFNKRRFVIMEKMSFTATAVKQSFVGVKESFGKKLSDFNNRPFVNMEKMSLAGVRESFKEKVCDFISTSRRFISTSRDFISTSFKTVLAAARRFLTTSQNLIWNTVALMSLNDYAARIGAPALAHVMTVKGFTFSVGKVSGVAAMPVKLVLIITALSFKVIENLCKLCDLCGKYTKMNSKVELLKLEPNSNNDAAKMDRLAKRAATLQEKIRTLKIEVKALQLEGGWLDRVNAVAGEGALEEVTPDDYVTLVKDAAVLKLLKQENPNLDAANRLLEMKPADFKFQKLNLQYTTRLSNVKQTAFQSAVDIISTGLKVATLMAGVGNIYMGVEAMRALFKFESTTTYKVLVEEAKLASAFLGFSRFSFFDAKETLETKPMNFIASAA